MEGGGGVEKGEVVIYPPIPASPLPHDQPSSQRMHCHCHVHSWTKVFARFSLKVILVPQILLEVFFLLNPSIIKVKKNGP